jgi:uncharacterized protein
MRLLVKLLFTIWFNQNFSYSLYRCNMDYSSSNEMSAALAWAPVDDGPMQLGRVVCISGAQVIVVLDKSVCGAGASYELRKGALIKMIADNSIVFGMVTGLSIPVPDSSDEQAEVFLGELDLVGEAHIDGGEFRRGVSAHPALGEPVYAATDIDLQSVYQPNRASMIQIGTVYQADHRPALISVDGLLGKHFTIVGTTGSGKSCSVALLLQRILEVNNKAHILLLDPHSEYAAAFGDKAELLTPANLELPFWLLTADEIREVVAGGQRNGEFVPEALTILQELIPFARKSFFRSTNSGVADSFITVDTPVPYSLRELGRLIDEQMGKLDKAQPNGPYRWLKNRLETLRADSRFGFMFGGMTVRDNMAEIISRIFRIPVGEKPITIVDLSGVPSEILNVVVSVLSRMTFDFALWSRGAVPILLVCEEAHRYAPADAAAGFEPTKEALARIAKEGRKYGVSLAIVTQRPSEIAPTILSQCNTLIAFRMTSVKDQEIVRGIVTDSAFGLLDFLPSLGNGEAIIAGEAVTVPQRIRLAQLDPDKKPRSATATFSDAWKAELADTAAVAEVVDRWRRQVR